MNVKRLKLHQSEVTCQLSPAGPPRNWPPPQLATLSPDWPEERKSVEVHKPPSPRPLRRLSAALGSGGAWPEPGPGAWSLDGTASPAGAPVQRPAGHGLQRSSTRMRGPLSPEDSSGHLDASISATCPSGSLLVLDSSCWFSSPALLHLLLPQPPLDPAAAACRHPSFH